MMVYSVQYDKLRIKIKGKRRFGPNYTVVEYILPLIRLNLEQDNEQQMELQDDNIEGSLLQVQLNYSSLPVIDASSEHDQEAFQTNFVDKYYDEPPTDVTGVLFVCIHNGTNLIPMDSSGTSDPYVMIFANKELVQMGHVVEETLNPQWDTKVEFFTMDYTQTTLSFVVMDRNPMVLPNVLLADDNDDFMGSCNMKLTKDDYCVFKKETELMLKFSGDPKRRTQDTVKKVGKLSVSVIFRPVSFIKNSIKATVNEGLPEGEPLHQRRTKVDAVTMEAILCQERGGLTVSILRARNLMALDLNGRSDPFVIVRVGTSKQEKYKTKVVYRTLNPVWNEQVTLAMPQKHERVSIEVWDKDPFTQERLGSVHFNHDDLLHLGSNENEKHWFDLDKAKSGEIQLQFGVTMPEKDKLDGISEENENIQSYSYGSDNSEEDFLILEQKNKAPKEGKENEVNGDTLRRQSTDHNKSKDRHTSSSSDGKDSKKEISFTKSLEMSTESSNGNGHIDPENGFIDFSGEPSKYYGLHGTILELISLNVTDIDEVYIKIKLDSIAKFSKPTRRTLLPKSERVLCRTSYYRVQERMDINEDFQGKTDGVSPCMYLIIEVKSEKKGKDIIDSHSMLLRNFFKGETTAIRTIELDNGGKMKLKLGHLQPTGSSSTGLRRKYSFKRATKFRTTIG
uniref:C2 domain-containing protein n=2 Tax=Clytia hemisphaerica TaxID=252671 RepID=A0A7M6DMV6_9CNID